MRLPGSGSFQLVLFALFGLALPFVPGVNFSLMITLLLFIGWATAWDTPPSSGSGRTRWDC